MAINKVGYCNTCVRNVPHIRSGSSPIYWVINILSFGLLRLGPWYCKICNQKRVRLPRSSRKALNYRDDPIIDIPVNQPDISKEGFVPAGNFLRTEKSLVMKAKRLKRFSEKYRDGLLDKILLGEVTLKEARDSEELTEEELIHWFKDRIQRLEMENRRLGEKLVEKEKVEKAVWTLQTAPKPR